MRLVCHNGEITQIIPNEKSEKKKILKREKKGQAEPSTLWVGRDCALLAETRTALGRVHIVSP